MAYVGERISTLRGLLNQSTSVNVLDAAGCASNILEFFKTELSEQDLSAAAACFFETEYGVLNIIESASKIRECKAVCSHLLNTIDWLLQHSQNVVQPHVHVVIKVCIKALNAFEANYQVKCTAWQVLRLLVDLEMASEHVKKILDLAKARAQHRSGVSVTELRDVFDILGSLDLHYHNVTQSRQIPESLVLYFKDEVLLNNYKLSLVGCIKGLTKCIKNKLFEPNDPIWMNILECVSIILSSEQTQRRLILMSDVFTLLENNIRKFIKHMKQDTKLWIERIKNQNTNREQSRKLIVEFYEALVAEIKRDNEFTGNVQIVRDCFQHFHDTLSRETEVDVNDVDGCGILSAVFPNYVDQSQIQDVLNIMTLRTSYCLRSSDADLLPNYVLCVARLCFNSPIKRSELIFFIEDLTVSLFAQSSRMNSDLVYIPLFKTLILIYRMNSSSFEKIVYQSLTKQCSDINSVSQYTELWKELFQINSGSLGLGFQDVERRSVIKLLYSTIFVFIFESLSKLSLQKNDNSSQPKPLSTLNREEVIIFTNLVVLVKAIIPLHEQLIAPFMIDLNYDLVLVFNEWISVSSWTINQNIIYTQVYSSFMDFLGFSIQTADSLEYFKNPESNRLSKVLVPFLENLLDKWYSWKNEIFTLYANLILSIPIELIQRVIFRAVPTYQLILEKGVTDLPLALRAFNNLSKWKNMLDSSVQKAFYEPLVQFMVPYLATYAFVESTSNHHESTTNKCAKETLDSIKKHIYLILASLDPSTCASLFRTEDNSCLPSHLKNSLQIKLSFADVKIPFSLDTLLPRIQQLCFDSPDSDIRRTSSDCLFYIINIIIGTSIQRNHNHIAAAWKCSVPIAIALSVDSDGQVSERFTGLMSQLIHFCHSKDKFSSLLTNIFMSCLLDGLCHQSNVTIRMKCGSYLAECVNWCKTLDNVDSELLAYEFNLKQLISILNTKLVHPLLNQRHGSMIGLNALIPEYKEDFQLVNKFSLNLMFNLLNCSVDFGDENPDLYTALDHVAGEILSFSENFNNESNERADVNLWKGNTLTDLTVWLYGLCWSPNTSTRSFSQLLVLKLVPLLPGSPKLEHFAQSIPVHEYNVSNLAGCEDSSKILGWFQFNDWLTSNNVTIQIVNSTILECIQTFSILYVENMGSLPKKSDSVCTSMFLYIYSKPEVIIETASIREFLILVVINNHKALKKEQYLSVLKRLKAIANIEWIQVLCAALKTINCSERKWNLFTCLKKQNPGFDFLDVLLNGLFELKEFNKVIKLLFQLKLLVQLGDFNEVLGDWDLTPRNTLLQISHKLESSNTTCSMTRQIWKELISLSFARDASDSLLTVMSIFENTESLEAYKSIQEHHFLIFENTLIEYLLEQPSLQSLLVQNASKKNFLFVKMLLKRISPNEQNSTLAAELADWLMGPSGVLEKSNFTESPNIVVDLLISVAHSKAPHERHEFLKNSPCLQFVFNAFGRYKLSNLPYFKLLPYIASDSEAFKSAMDAVNNDLLCTYKRDGLQHQLHRSEIWEQLISALELTGNAFILNSVCALFMQYQQFGLKTSDALRRVPKSSQQSFLTICYNNSTSLSSNPIQQLAFVKELFLPMISSYEEENVKSFVSSFLPQIVQTISKNTSFSSYESIESRKAQNTRILVDKMRSVLIIDTLFGRIHSVDAITNYIDSDTLSQLGLPKPTAQAFLNFYLIRLYDVRQLSIPDLAPKDEDLWRQFQCIALNGIVSVLSNLNLVTRQNLLYKHIFRRPSLWSVVCPQVMPTSSDQRFRLKEKIKLTDRLHRIKTECQPMTLSISLTPSLTMESNKFDFLVEKPTNDDPFKEQQVEVYLEMESYLFSKHECMPGLIYLVNLFGSARDATLSQELSDDDWIFCLAKTPACTANQCSTPGRLFALQLILSCHNVFEPYAKTVVKFLIQSSIFLCHANGLDYCLLHAIALALQWYQQKLYSSSDITIPDSDGQPICSRLFKELITACIAEASKSDKQTPIGYEAKEILKYMVILWGKILEVPHLVIENCLASKSFSCLKLGLHLCINLLKSGNNPFSDKSRFESTLITILKNSTTKNLHLRGEVIGMYLRTNFDLTFENTVKGILLEFSRNRKSVYIPLLYEIQHHYPSIITSRFVSKSIALMSDSKVRVNIRKCLEILNKSVNQVEDVQNIFDAVSTRIISSDEKLQITTLNLLSSLVHKIPPTEWSQIAKTFIELFSSAINSRIRRAILRFLVQVAHRLSSEVSFQNLDSDVSLLELTLSCLITGLKEADRDVHRLILDFWGSHSKRGSDLKDRILTLLNYYSSQNENIFLNFACYLILYLTFESTDYNEPIFSFPAAQSTVLTSKPSTKTSSDKAVTVIVAQGFSALTKSLQDMTLETEQERSPEIPTNTYHRNQFPFIQFTFSTFINAIQSLIKVDSEIARLILNSILNGVFQKLRGDQCAEFKGVFSKCVSKIIQRTSVFNQTFLSTLLDIVYFNNLSCQDLLDVCQYYRAEPVGIIIIENQLRDIILKKSIEVQEPRFKILKSSAMDDESKLWISLIELYKSINESDIVRGIVLGKLGNAGAFQQALDYQLLDEWDLAKTEFESLVEKTTGGHERILKEGYYECLRQLFEWEQLNQVVRKEVDNVNDLWSNQWSRDNLLPLYFESELMKLLDDDEASQESLRNSNRQFYNQVKEWEESHFNHIKECFAEYVSILCLVNNELELSKFYIQQSIDSVFKKLRLSNTNGFHQKAVISKLNRQLEIYSFIFDCPSPKSNAGCLRAITNNWCNNKSNVFDTPLNSARLSLYRNLFMDFLVSNFNLPAAHKNHLGQLKCTNFIQTVDFAVKRENYRIARKFVFKAQDLENENEAVRIHSRTSSVHLLKSKKLAKTEKMFESACEAILTCEEHCKQSSDWSVNFIFGKCYSRLAQSQLLNPNFNLSSLDESFQSIKNSKCSDNASLAIKYFKEAAGCATDQSIKGNAYFQIVQFCLHLTELGDKSFEEDITRCLVRSMACGNHKACQLFPTLFQMDNLTKHSQLLLRECDAVSSAQFLPWIPQLIGYLNDSLKEVVHSLLLRLADAYPQYVRLQLLLTSKLLPAYGSQEILQRVQSKLGANEQEISMFFEALASLCNPFVKLVYYLDQIMENKQDFNKVSLLFDELFEHCFRRDKFDQLRGPSYEACDEYKSHLMDLKGNLLSNNKNSEEQFKLLRSKFKQLQPTGEEVIKLETMSPYLANLRGSKFRNQIMMPNQFFIGDKDLSDIYVVSVSSQVRVVSSLRHPVKLELLGSNGQTYHWLHKFGEDLRQDQRIQQLLHSVSTELDNATILPGMVKTYKVVPVSPKNGLIEWIEDTVTLNAFINENYKEPFNGELISTIRSKCVSEHSSMIRAAGGNNYALCYNNAAKMFSQAKIESAYLKLTKYLPEDLLRSCIFQLSQFPENYFHLRLEFLKSHAVLSACHWVLGIGDRHLHNTLVCLKTCRLIGIDFGYAFGMSTQLLPVPEILPCRLGPQMLSLAGPLRESGIIRETMIRTLSSMNKSLMIALLQVFILEPTVDWTRHANRTDIIEEGVELLKKSIEISKEKLSGGHPVDIVKRQLQRKYKSAYLHVLESIQVNSKFLDGGSIGSSFTKAQQVELILGMATNNYLLGLSRAEYEPWI